MGGIEEIDRTGQGWRLGRWQKALSNKYVGLINKNTERIEILKIRKMSKPIGCYMGTRVLVKFVDERVVDLDSGWFEKRGDKKQ